MNSNEQFDALVIGAGIAGCASAHHLLSVGCTVAIIQQSAEVPGIESLSPHATRALQDIAPALGQPLGQVIAWWGSDLPSRMPSLGARVIQRNAVAAQLRAAIHQQDARFITGASSLLFERSNAHWLVSYRVAEANHVTKTRWIVDATGRAAAAARLLGARRHATDNLCCLSSSAFATNAPGVWTESTPDGWWNLCSDGAEAMLSFFSTSESIRTARPHFARRFANTKHLSSLTHPLGPPRIRACGSSLLRPCSGPGWVAVGDAVMTFQPLASAGIAKAMEDSAKAREGLDHPASYDQAQRQIFQNYQSDLLSQYNREHRWRSPFWIAMSKHCCFGRGPEIVDRDGPFQYAVG